MGQGTGEGRCHDEPAQMATNKRLAEGQTSERTFECLGCVSTFKYLSRRAARASVDRFIGDKLKVKGLAEPVEQR